MAKYTSWKDFEENVPKKWAKYTDPDEYEKGMNRLAPDGKSLKKARKDAYKAHTDEAHGKKLVSEFATAMFE